MKSCFMPPASAKYLSVENRFYPLNPLESDFFSRFSFAASIGSATPLCQSPRSCACAQPFPDPHRDARSGEACGTLARQPLRPEIIPFGKTDGVGTVSKLLREGRFDTAVIFPNSFRSAPRPWLAGIPIRIGHTGGWRAALLTRKVPRPENEIPMRKKSGGRGPRLIQNTPERPRETFPSTAHHLHQSLRLVAELGGDHSGSAKNRLNPSRERNLSRQI